MKKIFLDIETYYDQVYSLRNMTPLEYALDKRFEMLGCGIAEDDNPPRFMPQEKVVAYLQAVNEPYAAITHNALFDMTVFAWRYAIHPTVCIDTLGMCRALLAHQTKRSSVSLSTVLAHLGLQEKLTTIEDMKGVHFDALIRDPELLIRFTTYTIRDVRGCREIFNRLIDSFPAAELRIQDRLIRMVTMPQLLLDKPNLEIYYAQVIAKKQQLMAQLGHDKAKYLSNEQFAELLREQGVEPPLKKSPATGKMTYAFAKTDEDFLELRDHPDPTVQALVAARLGVKSTIEETRTKSFINIATLTAHRYQYSWMPVPLKFSGAHTHRYSGDWKLNMQNLSARKTKVLRSSIRAPSGMYIVAIDASQIEARLVAWLAGQSNLLEQFSVPTNDVYAWFGSIIYGRQISKKTHPVERFNSKTIVLGLGFGMSAGKLLIKLKTDAAQEGIQAEYTIEECQEWVSSYRAIFPFIPYLWKRCGWILEYMLDPSLPAQPPIGPCYVEGHTIVLPSGLRLYYNDIQWDGNEITYRFGSGRRKIYGAKVTENIVQALDRQHVAEANMRIEDRCAELGMDVRLAMQVHDENIYVVPDNCVQLVTQIALEEMCRPPKWAPTIPLAAEAKCGVSYGALA